MSNLKIEGKIENVELAKLLIDESYQRGKKAYRRVIAREFNPEAAGVLLVARRPDGSLYTIDGQQRTDAMLACGIRTWKATVVYSSGSEYEANIFKLINGRATRKGLNAPELFRACLVAKDPTAEAVVRCVEGVGLRIKPSKGGTRGWPELVCVGALYREVAARGEAIVSRALKVMVDAWPGQADCMRDLLPVALVMVYSRVGDQIDDARMVQQLAAVPPRKILLDSSSSLEGRFASAQKSIVAIYNRRLSKGSQLRLVASPGEEAA